MILLAEIPTWLRIATVIAVAFVFVIVCVVIFRNAMRHPNNGNEFSEDNLPSG